MTPAATAHARGRPQRLTAMLDRCPAGSRRALVRAEIPGGPSELRGTISASAGQGPAILRLRVPPTTPPGRYASTLRLGDAEQALIIEVEPHARTRLLASEGEFESPAGAKHAFTVGIVNTGNVALDVPRKLTLRLTDGDLLGTILGAVSSAPSGEDRLRAFADGLAAGDGGSVELTVTKGAGELEAGGARELRARFAMPDGLREGREYIGQWRLGEARYTLRLRPVAAARAPARRRRSPRRAA